MDEELCARHNAERQTLSPETLFANAMGLYARTRSPVGLPTRAIFLAC